MTKPFLKWAGGKRRMLHDLRRFVPENFNRYFEPFVGGGAMYFGLQPDLKGRSAFISDSNGRLMTTYSAVRDDVDEVLKALVLYQLAHDNRGKDFYYETRDQIPSDPCKLAAWMIFMNKTCFNGLYRVNKGGSFNVPYGKYDDPRILDTESIRACSEALASCFVMHGDLTQFFRDLRCGGRGQRLSDRAGMCADTVLPRWNPTLRRLQPASRDVRGHSSSAALPQRRRPLSPVADQA